MTITMDHQQKQQKYQQQLRYATSGAANMMTTASSSSCYSLSTTSSSSSKNSYYHRHHHRSRCCCSCLPSSSVLVGIILLLLTVLLQDSVYISFVADASSAATTPYSVVTKNSIIRKKTTTAFVYKKSTLSTVISYTQPIEAQQATVVLRLRGGGVGGGGNDSGDIAINDNDFSEDEEEDDDDDNIDLEEEKEQTNNDIRQHPQYAKLLTYRMQQQVLLQLRATHLSEALVARGVPTIPSLHDIQTPDGQVPPKRIDWDCAVSTEDDPKNCLICYEPEVGAKIICPMGLADSDKWITLRELNRLRRDDPSKVESMWNNQYAILSSWFGTSSRYTLLQHVGVKGVLLNALLQGNALSTVVGIVLIVCTIICMPIIQYIVGRFLVSGYLWMKWPSWSRFVHVGLPFKLLMIQLLFNQLNKVFGRIIAAVKERLVNLECRILEETIPLTVGVPDDDDNDEEDIVEKLSHGDDDDDEDDDDDDDDESLAFL